MENTDGERKATPSIPANYISILQLRERWINEKDRKRKEEEEEEEEEEGRRRQQAEEERKIEDDLKKAEVKGKREDIDENRLNRNNRDRNSKKNESVDGGEARCSEPEVTAAIVSERGDDAGLPKSKRRFRKRYDSRKSKNQYLAAVKEDVVDECGSTAPPEFVVTENNTPAKGAILVYRKKGEKATGKKSVESREKTAIEQFEKFSIERGETKNLKAQSRSSKRNGLNQRNDSHPQRVAVEEDIVECGTEDHTPVKDGFRVYRKKRDKATGKLSVGSREKAVSDVASPHLEDIFSIKSGQEKGETKNLKAQTSSLNRTRLKQRHDLPPRRVRTSIGDATMVWVKKEQNERANDGLGSGV